MKKRLTLTILFVPFIIMAQKPFNRSTFEIIDKYEMSVKRIGGTLENFAMSRLDLIIDREGIYLSA
jgi:hypothetical protein